MMKTYTQKTRKYTCIGLQFVALAVLLWLQPISLRAQKLQGDPAVYGKTGSQAYSPAYIDAVAFVGTSTDMCTVLNLALAALSSTTNYTGGAGIVDARGLNPASLTCNNNPWSTFSSASPAPPSVVLLPAGTIKATTSWTLWPGTRLIGEGGEDPGMNNASVARTTIQAQTSTFTLETPIIQMGVGANCVGVVVEDLVLDGQGLDINGIDNQYCGDGSYVKNVTFYQIIGIGLNVYNTNDPNTVSSANSGPYSNITFDLGTALPASATRCVYLNTNTRGIHGMTCTANSYTAVAVDGIQLASGASGNSIEDVRIEGFQNGVYIPVSDVVMKNILGDSKTKNATQIVSVVNIVSGATNVALIGITNNCSATQSCGTSSDNDTITDGSTGQHIRVTTDPFVAMYVLGNKITVGASNAYSRYTTSPSVANWSVGTSAISITPPTACSSPGSLYSNSSSSANPGLYVCSVGGQWAVVK